MSGAVLIVAIVFFIVAIVLVALVVIVSSVRDRRSSSIEPRLRRAERRDLQRRNARLAEVIRIQREALDAITERLAPIRSDYQHESYLLAIELVDAIVKTNARLRALQREELERLGASDATWFN